MKGFKSKKNLFVMVIVIVFSIFLYKYLRLFHAEIFPVDNKFIIINESSHEIKDVMIYQSLTVSESNLTITSNDTLLASCPKLKVGDKKTLYYDKAIPSDGNLVLVYKASEGKQKYKFSSEYLPYGTRWSKTEFITTEDDNFFE